MARYGAELDRIASSTLSVGTIVADAVTPRRLKIYDLLFGSPATPADNAFLWQLQRCTTAGTGSAVVPNQLDTADAAALFDVLENLTVEATLTAGAIPLAFPLNQRASFRWVAAPGSELVAPATAGNGFAIRTPTIGAAVDIVCTALVDEQ